MAKNLVEHFSIIEDPRRGRVAHDLTGILVIVSCALFAGVETFVDIAGQVQRAVAASVSAAQERHTVP
jgi:hypothetical protein